MNLKGSVMVFPMSLEYHPGPLPHFVAEREKKLLTVHQMRSCSFQGFKGITHYGARQLLN
jgi:hypothetical protein